MLDNDRIQWDVRAQRASLPQKRLVSTFETRDLSVARGDEL